MSGFDIALTLDKKNRALLKSFNIRLGFDIKYVESYILNYTRSYANKLNYVFNNKRLFNNLSTIKHKEISFQWVLRFNGIIRLRIHKNHMAIYFDFWQLIQVNDMKSKKVYTFAIYRYIEKVEPKDLIQEHWNFLCSKVKTRDGSARIIQQAYRRF
ncbi:hypothetical protein Glove_25g59 [Diversispora epigaea]|uniref:Uncharacterized protein n=1 Tax=Diversispora epigaea TaxID=1348612 RepID=A0A397JIM0_9GLOM|nr:hypothetical protein Glove_25g59 [Diversispora epigaea]